MCSAECDGNFQQKLDINAANESGDTALHVASRWGFGMYILVNGEQTFEEKSVGICFVLFKKHLCKVSCQKHFLFIRYLLTVLSNIVSRCSPFFSSFSKRRED